MTTVLVLGAGFTKAFFSGMPLLRDAEIVPPLQDLARGLPTAQRVLEAELAMNSGKQIDVERLMSRLESGAPFDSRGRGEAELRVLLAELRQIFVDRIRKAKGPLDAELIDFAAVLVRDGLTCLTFNYDDVLDEHMAKTDLGKRPMSDGWTPEGGYGFKTLDPHEAMRTPWPRQPRNLLLKLHGSMNWRVERGQSPPFPLGAIYAVQSWYPRYSPPPLTPEEIDATFEPEPVIVPPVLLKSDLQTQPLFRTIWTQAFAALQEATRVYFVGYSLPVTDLAARSLFAEAISPLARVTVVTRGTRGSREPTKERYRQIWPGLADEDFTFRDARNWAREFVRRSPAEGTPGQVSD